MIQKKIKKSHQHWNDWKFQIHWNILEWVLPKIHDVKKKPFGTSSQKLYLKDKTHKNHFVGHSLMKSMDVDEFFKRRVIISELVARLNDDDEIQTAGIIEGQT